MTLHAVVRAFTMHGSAGHSILREKWLDWLAEHQSKPGCSPENGWGFGRVTHYSWHVGEQRVEIPVEQWLYAHVLPDATGFIGFEKEWQPNNCLLLDAYGKERMRLTVPWQLTDSPNPESARAPTSFTNISEPYINPTDGRLGEFGVTAWVELAGRYYFELNYHTGEFLWGKEIRD